MKEFREQNIIAGKTNESLDQIDFDNLSQEEIIEMRENDPNLYLKYLEYIDMQVQKESEKHYGLDKVNNLEKKEPRRDFPHYAWQDRKDLQ